MRNFEKLGCKCHFIVGQASQITLRVLDTYYMYIGSLPGVAVIASRDYSIEQSTHIAKPTFAAQPFKPTCWSL